MSTSAPRGDQGQRHLSYEKPSGEANIKRLCDAITLDVHVGAGEIR
jgi:hypothetical protein